MLTNQDKSGNSAKSAINKNSIVSSLHRRLKQFARVLLKRLAVYEPPSKILDLKNMNLFHLCDYCITLQTEAIQYCNVYKPVQVIGELVSISRCPVISATFSQV